MSTTIKLTTTDAQLHDLQHTVNEAREGSETVRVSKEALRRLLLDHHAMYGALSRRREEPAAEENSNVA